MNKLLYAGLDKAEFDALRPEAVKETRKSLKGYTLFAAVLFALLAAFGAFSGIASLNRWYYVILAIFNVAVWLCLEKRGVKGETTLMALAYATIAVLYAVSIGLTLLHPSLPALTIIAVMILTPFLFTDSPVYVIALNILATVALCLLSLNSKPREVALDDSWNAISFCMVSIAVTLMQRKQRFRALAKDRQIRYLSETDLMTGARNRNVYERVLERYPKGCKQSLTCVYIDVNGLHNLNNTQGHKSGDKMLQTVAKALLDRFGSEHVYRVGGDEFVAFAPDVAEEVVAKDLKRISEGLSAQNYDISVGIISGEKGAMDLQGMIAEAEKEMYRKKELYYQQPEHERRRR
jgi:diguanylate cyclase (GGDEF)-like protein